MRAVELEASEDVNFAFSLYLQAASFGLDIAQERVGDYYYSGLGCVEKDASQAVFWYRKAAEQDKGYGLYSLGMCYEAGFGVPKDEKKAFAYYLAATNKDNHIDSAFFKIGEYYYYGIGVERNTEAAFLYFKNASLLGNELGTFFLGACYFNGEGTEQNSYKAFECFKKAAEVGVDLAQYELARCYYCGIGTKKNISEAIQWLTLSVQQGYEVAITELASLYYNGTHVKQNQKLAFEMYQIAAKKEDPIAQYNLALLNYRGDCAAKDDEKAFYWANKAAKNGLAQAMTMVAIQYINGIGVQKDKNSAFQWAQKAAENNDHDAKFLLGSFYEYGHGTVKNGEISFEWYTDAAKNGNIAAISRLALCYSRSFGVESEQKKVFALLQTISKEKDIIGSIEYIVKKEYAINYAKTVLGFYYETGLGVACNEKQAIVLFSEVANTDCDFVLDILPELRTYYSEQKYKPEVEKEYQRMFDERMNSKFDEFKRSQEEELKRYKQEMYQEIALVEENRKKDIKQLEGRIDDLSNDIKAVFEGLAEEKKKQKELFDRVRDLEEKEDSIIAFIKGQNEKLVEAAEKEQRVYERIERELKELYGKGWMVLDEYSRKSLISAEVLLAIARDKKLPDYSGICICASAALEHELKKYFFYSYKDFISSMKDAHPTAPFERSAFTMGLLPYLFGIKKGKKKTGGEDILISEQERKENSACIQLYTRKMFGKTEFINKECPNCLGEDSAPVFCAIENEHQKGESNLCPFRKECFLGRCEKVRICYRNVSAHSGKILNEASADECCTEIIGRKELEGQYKAIQGILKELISGKE